MSNITKGNNFSLTPSTLDEAMKFSEIMAKSTIVPKQYQGRSGDILVAVQMGADLGLKPMQALQNIAVINGRPCIWGDALLALVQAHPAFEDIKETIENGIATCTIKRKGQSSHTVTFSIDDAKKAGLWGKPGPWTNYSNRMLQLRARGFALRDRFADALGGLITAEEAQDYPSEAKDITPVSKTENLASKLDALLPAEEVAIESSKDDLVEKLQLLLETNGSKELDDKITERCDKLGLKDPFEMNIEQLKSTVEWIEKKTEFRQEGQYT